MRLVRLWNLESGEVIVGDDGGHISKLSAEMAADLAASVWDTDMAIIPAAPHSHRLFLPGGDEIALAPFNLDGLTGQAGYSPMSRVWYVRPEVSKRVD
jgi:hypothetical protein